MDLSTLRPAYGAVKKGKRIARGEGSGKGGTASKGHKGAQSRSGYSKKLGFEGGQMPIQRRVPKFGFKSPNRVEYKAINLDTLQFLSEKSNEITLDLLKDNGLASSRDLIKVLGRGELKAKITVSAHAFSKTAKDAIANAGGEIIAL